MARVDSCLHLLTLIFESTFLTLGRSKRLDGNLTILYVHLLVFLGNYLSLILVFTYYRAVQSYL